VATDTDRDADKKKAEDKSSGPISHIRSQSNKLLEMMTSSKKDLHLRDRDQMAESDDDDEDSVESLQKVPSASASHEPAGLSSSDVKFKAGKTGKLDMIDSTSSAAVSKQVPHVDQRKKSLGKSKLRQRNKGSLELMHVSQRRRPSTKMRKTQSHGGNDEPDGLVRRQTTGTQAQQIPLSKAAEAGKSHTHTGSSLPSLGKTKSSKLLKKNASSKNILLRHLDNRPPKGGQY